MDHLKCTCETYQSHSVLFVFRGPCRWYICEAITRPNNRRSDSAERDRAAVKECMQRGDQITHNDSLWIILDWTNFNLTTGTSLEPYESNKDTADDAEFDWEVKA